MTREAIEKVAYNDVLYAIIVRASLPKEGYNFVTRDEDTMQLGVNHYKAGSEIPRHKHVCVERNISTACEMIHIDEGSCEVSLYTKENDEEFYTVTLNTGDTIIALDGGHGMKILEDTRIVEVKQGPYMGPENDKVTF